MFVPGLLQTDDYMRAVIRGAHLESSEEVGRRVRLRMARQTLLTREHPPRLWAVMDEAALRRPVGGPGVMRGQLERLLDATKLPNVTLQVLPFEAGAHPPWWAPSASCGSPTGSCRMWCTSSI